MNKHIFRVVTTALFLSITSTAIAQKLYKWVDEDGNVTFSDQVPPEQVDLARERINEDGITVDKVDKAVSQEEFAKAEAERKAAEQKKKEEELRLAEEEKLIQSYANADHILSVRDEKLEPILKSIKSSTDFMGSKSKHLSGLMDRVASQERTGNPVSENSKLAIQRTREEITELKAFIERKKLEYMEIKGKYEAEHAAYVDITTRRNALSQSER